MHHKKNNKATILIIDDKKANIFALEKLLEKKEREILNATNGKDGLHLAISREVDLIILDVNMPDMDGFEVAQILKSNRRTKDIPIIFATAEKTEHKNMLKGFDEGAVDYLFKPLDPEITRAKVAVLLQIQLQKREVMQKNQELEKCALLINNSADIIGIVDVNTFQIEEINNAFTKILGYTIQEARENILPYFLSQEDRRRLLLLAKETDDQLSFETKAYCKDRSTKILHWHVVARDGKWFVNARDVTDIKEAEKVKHYLATVVKQSSDAIYIHDEEGRIISWNEGAEKLYDYTEDEALKMKVWNIIPDYLQPHTQGLIRSVFDGHKINLLETRRVNKHGKLLDVLFSAAVVEDTHTRKKSMAITERDITEQKVADEQIKQLNSDLQANIVKLENANRDLETFSYSVSHDLRAPLRAVGGFARMLREDYATLIGKDGQRLIENIDVNIKKMNMLISELLEFAKLDSHVVQKKEVDCKALLEQVIKSLEQSTKHHAQIKIGNLPIAMADRVLLEQVWTNLLSNAVKYSSKKEQPIVEIGAEPGGLGTVYYIKDNGAGFSMQYVGKLFNTFQRLHSPAEFDGIGIGLAMVHRIIDKHGGKVWAEGEEDKGASFYFTLPEN